METPSSTPAVRELARRLLAASPSAPGTCMREVVLVSDKLRLALMRFAGADGFTSLLRRALVLAGEEVPALRHVTVGPDGRLTGLESLAAAPATGGPKTAEHEAALAITSHLLGLLITFIGKPFTLRLVQEGWPETPLEATNPTTEADR